MKQATIAYQVEVNSPLLDHKQVYFVGSGTEEQAIEALRACGSLPPTSELRIIRSLSNAAIEQFEIGPGTIFKWI